MKVLEWNNNYAMITCFIISGITMIVSFGVVL